jgi:hypothetical protein
MSKSEATRRPLFQLFQRYAALCNNIPPGFMLGRSHQREARSTIEVGPLGESGVLCVANPDMLGGRNALFRLAI